MNPTVIENAFLERLTRSFTRSPRQLNGLQESDAELVRLPGSSTVLAITTDSIVEELDAGLYTDPFLIGWMTVMVNASDLAAVGAEPLGLVLSETLPARLLEEFLEQLQSGIEEAARATVLPVLGGDTNAGQRLQMSATALGWISDGRPLTRLGATAGDHVFASGALGAGGAFALHQVLRRGPGPTYRPPPRLREGRLLRDHATCCMDTSDGLLATLDQLMRLNGVGFELDVPVERYLEGEALEVSRHFRIPPWTMLAGPHGEFELLFTVPPGRVEALLRQAAHQGWYPVRLGTVVSEPGVTLNGDDQVHQFDTGAIRNLFAQVNGDPRRYLTELLKHDGAPGGPRGAAVCQP